MAGSNNFALTPKRWIEVTNAIGIVSKTGCNKMRFNYKVTKKFKNIFIAEHTLMTYTTYRLCPKNLKT